MRTDKMLNAHPSTRIRDFALFAYFGQRLLVTRIRAHGPGDAICSMKFGGLNGNSPDFVEAFECTTERDYEQANIAASEYEQHVKDKTAAYRREQ